MDLKSPLWAEFAGGIDRVHFSRLALNSMHLWDSGRSPNNDGTSGNPFGAGSTQPSSGLIPVAAAAGSDPLPHAAPDPLPQAFRSRSPAARRRSAKRPYSPLPPCPRLVSGPLLFGAQSAVYAAPPTSHPAESWAIHAAMSRAARLRTAAARCCFFDELAAPNANPIMICARAGRCWQSCCRLLVALIRAPLRALMEPVAEGS